MGLIILGFLAAPLLISTNEHIRLAEFIDLPAKRLRLGSGTRHSPSPAESRIIVIAWSGVGAILHNIGTRTPMLGISRSLFAVPMPLGFAIAAGWLSLDWFAPRRAAGRRWEIRSSNA